MSSRGLAGGVIVLAALVGACSESADGAPALVVVVTSTTAVAAPTTVPVTTTAGPAPTRPEPTAAEVAPLDQIRLEVELVADGFRQPILALARPDDPRLYVADQSGLVYALDLVAGTTTVVLDIVDQVRFSGEQGLLGVAFDAATMVVHYSARDGATILAEYVLDAAGMVDVATRRQILRLDQPAGNHNGGMVAFGPDGLLYVALGDGGGANDQFDNGQDPFTLLGTILRIDPQGGDPYGIPPDNPFVDATIGAPEVWAWGLRNPWRFAFDGDDIWVGDVGQGTWEEIDVWSVASAGINAGWPVLEGTHCFRFDPCEGDPFLAPVFEYRHESGRCSVTGGVVYRGASIPDLVGSYLFGDYCTGDLWALRPGPEIEVDLLNDPEAVLPRLPGLTSFGTGPDGEVYLLQTEGLVWRLVPG